MLKNITECVDGDTFIHKGYVITIADYTPTPNVRAIPLSKGDTLCIMSEISVRLGDYYKDTNGVITQILYEPKKWWKFWIKKKQIGYMVQWQ